MQHSGEQQTGYISRKNVKESKSSVSVSSVFIYVIIIIIFYISEFWRCVLLLTCITSMKRKVFFINNRANMCLMYSVHQTR